MATQRERIYQEFLRTPDEDKGTFCGVVFSRYLNASMAEPEPPKDYLSHGLESLRLAVAVDAERDDLWKSFLQEFAKITDRLKKEAQKRRREQRNQQKSKKVQ